tara:strand:+ start:38 stop:226 length:189 start_codon:yes stop_codon:yes gene_type:complete
MTDKVQKSLDKYEKQFNQFMINLQHQVKNDKAFKNIKGNMFFGIIIAMKKDINSFLKLSKKK